MPSKSGVELKKGSRQIHTLTIDWHGTPEQREEIEKEAYTHLLSEKIIKLIIVVKTVENLAQTCFRMIWNLVKKVEGLGIKKYRVVIPNKTIFAAAWPAGFDHDNRVFNTQAEAKRKLWVRKGFLRGTIGIKLDK